MTWQDAEKIKQAAYVMSQSACAIIKALGMVAENQDRLNRGNQMVYVEEAFDKLINEFGIHHNSVMTLLNVN